MDHQDFANKTFELKTMSVKNTGNSLLLGRKPTMKFSSVILMQGQLLMIMVFRNKRNTNSLGKQNSILFGSN